MSLLVSVVVLAFAVLLGGAAAFLRGPARGALAVLRTFAVVAAASIALLHLLPEAVGAVGIGALVAALVGALVPAALERIAHANHTHHAHEDAPTTALAMGYAAVVAHQAGEGAALASLANTGALSVGVVLAIAAHTVPLAMVVAIRVLEAREHVGGVPSKHPGVVLALVGVAAATAIGALAGTLVDDDRLRAIQPWLLAVVAGLLLHALVHDAPSPQAPGLGARIGQAIAGGAGLALACFGVEGGDWLDRVPVGVRALAVTVVAAAIATRTWFSERRRSV